MAIRRNIYRSWINVAIFVILEIAALGMLRRSQEDGFFLKNLSNSFSATVLGISQSIGDYFALKRINEELARENFTLNASLARLNLEAVSAKEDEGNINIGKYRFTHASVIKISRNKHHNFLIIDKGSKDGIDVHTGVITSQGVVGIVQSVSENYCFAISFLNDNFNLSTRIGREGPVGPMSWDGKSLDGAVLREISLHNKFQEGDTVFTSGHSSIFPPDIPIGKVGKSKIINGATYDVDIRLFQDFSTIRFVTLVINKDREEIDALEKKEEEKP